MDNFVELLKSYISSSEEVHRLQQKNLKIKITELNQQKFELEELSNKLIIENNNLKKKLYNRNLQLLVMTIFWLIAHISWSTLLAQQ